MSLSRLMRLSPIFLFLVLVSCANCRETAIRDARVLAPQHPTRVACYHTAPRPSLGYVFWPSHCQAQAELNGEWKWVSNGKITGETDFSLSRTKQETEIYTPEQMERLIQDNPRADWWKIALLILLI